MRSVIFKYPITVDNQGIMGLNLPLGSTILTVKEQRGNPFVWVLEPKDTQLRARYQLLLMGTGIEFVQRPEFKYLDTVLLHGSALVLHCFITGPQELPDAPGSAPTA